MTKNTITESESDLPAKLGNPARRALVAAGYERLEQLTSVTESEIGKLHGMGPKGLEQFRSALAARSQSFADTARGDHHDQVRLDEGNS